MGRGKGWYVAIPSVRVSVFRHEVVVGRVCRLRVGQSQSPRFGSRCFVRGSYAGIRRLLRLALLSQSPRFGSRCFVWKFLFTRFRVPGVSEWVLSV